MNTIKSIDWKRFASIVGFDANTKEFKNPIELTGPIPLTPDVTKNGYVILSPKSNHEVAGRGRYGASIGRNVTLKCQDGTLLEGFLSGGIVKIRGIQETWLHAPLSMLSPELAAATELLDSLNPDQLAILARNARARAK